MRLPVITYHAVGEGPFPLWTPTELFEAHLDAFKQAGYRTVSLAALAQAIRRGEPLPDDALVLTFDDGYDSVHLEAWPRLRERDFTATVFVVSGYCGRYNQWPTQGQAIPIAPMVSWKQVAELAANGWEIGAHTATHAPLTRLQPEAAAKEVLDSKMRIESEIGQAAPVFAYPYGDVSAAVLDCVRQNFAGAAGTRLGFARMDSDPLVLPRIDAFYLTPFMARNLRTFGFRQYLRLRQTIRTVRSHFSHPWDETDAKPSADSRESK